MPARTAERNERAFRTGNVVVTRACYGMGAAIVLINLAGLTVGFGMGAESAWFSEEVERIGWIGAIVFAALVLGGTIAWLATHVGAREPGTWALMLAFGLVCTQISLISAAVLADGLTVWLARTPHRQEARFHSARAVAGSARTASCPLKITVQPELPQFASRYASFCAPAAFVEPGLKQGDKVVMVGRANWLGFVAERVERIR